ncbi:MAG: 50S ribosomal protein L22 [Candidatus Thermoplasmatota archaeon]|nr:50S ribosomal protein L22 [Candidatus Thermoplasmatota archaeon]
MKGYTYRTQTGRAIARARGVELPISPKKSYEVLNAIRGLPLDRARKILEDAEQLKKAIPFRRYNQETAHHTGVGPGRFPKKVAHQVLQVLKNAEANAEYEGLDTDRLYVHVAASSRGRIIKARMPRAHGRATNWNEQTTHIEIVLAEEKEEK